MVSLQKQALGRVSHLGYLYDERSDSFLNFSLFNDKEINASAIKTTNMPYTDISYLISASTSDKLHKLSVDAQLKLSVMCGLVTLNGSGKYLSDKKENSDSSSADLVYKLSTVYEEVDIAKLSKDQINVNSLKMNATHVVVGIKWGANVIGSFEYKFEKGDSKKEIEGKHMRRSHDSNNHLNIFFNSFCTIRKT